MKTGNDQGQQTTRGFSAMQVMGMILASMCIAIFCTAFAIKIFLFPAPFKPVELSVKEEKTLETKLQIFEGFAQPVSTTTKNTESNQRGTLTPEKYSEEGASREIKFNERELNALVAKNTDLANKLAIDLAQDMISMKLLIPVDPDFPMLGGKTLKIKAGAELAYRSGKPVVKLKGVSVMGVPMPNSWLGGLKNIDLIEEYGANDGFWQGFADGVDSISVQEGSLNIKLKE